VVAVAVGVWLAVLVSGPPAGLVAIARQEPIESSLFLRFVCAGMVVDDDVVVTAAHCLPQDEPGRFEVVAGVRDLCGGEVRDGQPVASVLAVDGVADVMYLRVPGVRFEAGPALGEAQEGVEATAWGWGGESRAAISCSVGPVALSVLGEGECAPRRGEFGLGGTYFCVVPPGDEPNTCGGDSGGPVLQRGRLVGITSAGIGCGPRSIGFAARVGPPPTP
jgi:secreted trypsin-like serine protease